MPAFDATTLSLDTNTDTTELYVSPAKKLEAERLNKLAEEAEKQAKKEDASTEVPSTEPVVEEVPVVEEPVVAEAEAQETPKVQQSPV